MDGSGEDAASWRVSMGFGQSSAWNIYEEAEVDETCMAGQNDYGHRLLFSSNTLQRDLTVSTSRCFFIVPCSFLWLCGAEVRRRGDLPVKEIEG